MIAPVVVNPETASKMASVTDMSSCLDKRSGAAPAPPMTTQNSATTRKPSRTRSSRRFLRTGHHTIAEERDLDDLDEGQMHGQRDALACDRPVERFGAPVENVAGEAFRHFLEIDRAVFLHIRGHPLPHGGAPFTNVVQAEVAGLVIARADPDGGEDIGLIGNAVLLDAACAVSTLTRSVVRQPLTPRSVSRARH